MNVNVLIPRRAVPPLKAPLLGGGRFDLAVAPAPTFHLLVFYRGLHCPLCAKYLIELERLHEEFIQRGVRPLALSSDTEDRAQTMAEKVHAQSLRFAYDLPLATARAWGLTLSTSRGRTSIGIEEPALFSEPGLFLVSPDGTLYWGSTQTMPFARPHFDEILGAIDFVVKNNYPARGEYTGTVIPDPATQALDPPTLQHL
jgi:peroxiredoxin